MIEMKVMGIALDTRTGSPIVVLHDKENRKALPIWIGSAEASAIIRKIENLVVARPMTHDLIINIIEKTGYKLDRVYKIDLALAYEAVTEIKYLNTPPAVAINEVIELAKAYSTEKSPKFLNGLLSAYLKGEN